MVESLPFDVEKLIEFCRQNDVVRIALFGSAARGEAEEQSDIDLVVEFSKRISLLRFAAFGETTVRSVRQKGGLAH
jgi:predicted nucleotidyltransferase